MSSLPEIEPFMGESSKRHRHDDRRRYVTGYLEYHGDFWFVFGRPIFDT